MQAGSRKNVRNVVGDVVSSKGGVVGILSLDVHFRILAGRNFGEKENAK